MRAVRCDVTDLMSLRQLIEQGEKNSKGSAINCSRKRYEIVESQDLKGHENLGP